jgi:hypothetical protein
MNNAKEKLICIISRFLKTEYSAISYERELENILEKCDLQEQKKETLICKSLLKIIQQPGIEFHMSKESYQYLCRCICFLKTDFELKVVKVYRFSWWKILAIVILAIYVFLFLMRGIYFYSGYLLSLVLINIDTLYPMYIPSPPDKYMYYPFKSDEEWLHFKHYLEELGITENCDLENFRIKQTIFKKIYNYAFNALLYPVLILSCIFPERCAYLMQETITDEQHTGDI